MMRLKELREQKKLSQREVAEEIGCSANVYSRYERGEREPDISTLILLATYFGTTVDYIIGFSVV